MAELMTIADTVEQVAEAISVALKIDVEIVDAHNVRVGATGKIKALIGQKQENGHVSRFVLRTGEPSVIEQPGFHRLCYGCKLQHQCDYTSGVLCPVLYRGEAIGVISLVTFDQEKKRQIIENRTQLMDFISKMAELLSDKLAKQHLHDMLQLRTRELDTVLDSVYEGVLVADAEGKITFLNAFAQAHLSLEPHKVIGQPVSSILPGSILAQAVRTRTLVPDQKIVYREGKNKIGLYSRAFPIEMNGEFKGAVETFQLTEDLHKIASRLDNEGETGLDDILGAGTKIAELKRLVGKLSESPSNVLITGESGTGKELMARAIHQGGSRKDQPFIAVNCGAIPEPLLESELFGYESGAFTGARQGGKPGKFELADKGTLLLDEIGDMPIYLQAKLLRVLQERKVERIGGSKSIPVDVRIIAATHRNLEEMVQNREFREDLFYRLNVVPMVVTPLRERKEDIPLLVHYFIEKANRKLQKHFLGCDPELLETFLSYSWPGNIRELENTIEYMCNIESMPGLTLASLPERILKALNTPTVARMGGYSLKDAVRETEQAALTRVLSQYSLSRDIDQILNILDISRATLYRKLKEYRLSQD
ncbi:sigma-54 interaction domain-containing protein [Paenibacillus apii]|uniref:sigma-54 interaction domain-containing protein n=1 Tax=Paenibacillus apii TaxID=1850370 RepID=UPI00143965BC|nr:sigma 54-interacting transcriptional regulator [Paenibacillus apii]NJJ38634.1 sigma 54-interacting transcriptional regulator [Paenibacillus apii]